MKADFHYKGGQMADIFGRHASLQAVLILMTLGSTLCTAAPTSSFPMLLLGRGFQGVACAGISVLVRVIISDKVSLQENAKNWSFFALTGGCSYAIGPVVGGYLTSTSWRWCFAVNLPFCVLGILIALFVLRKELVGPQPLPGVDEGVTPAGTEKLTAGPTVWRRLMTVDIGGQLLFLFGFGLVILAFTWAGDTYPWGSYKVLVPLVLGALLVVVWIVYEYQMAPSRPLGRRLSYQKAMIPWQFIKSRNVGLLFYVNFSSGMAIYSVSPSSHTHISLTDLHSLSPLTWTVSGSLLRRPLLHPYPRLFSLQSRRPTALLCPGHRHRRLRGHVVLQRLAAPNLPPALPRFCPRSARHRSPRLGHVNGPCAEHLWHGGAQWCRHGAALHARHAACSGVLPRKHREYSVADGNCDAVWWSSCADDHDNGV